MKIKRIVMLLSVCLLYGAYTVPQDDTQSNDETPQAQEAEVATDDQSTPETSTDDATINDEVTGDVIDDAADDADEVETDEVSTEEDIEFPDSPLQQSVESVQKEPQQNEQLAGDMQEVEDVQVDDEVVDVIETDTMDESDVLQEGVELTEAEPEMELPAEEEQEEGIIDTMEIDDNVNWLEVRKYLQDAIVVLEQISTSFSQVSDMRMQYLQKRNQADKQFDQFMKDIGVDLGQLYQQITSYIERLNAERSEDGDLSVDERALLDTLNTNKTKLEQLQQDIVSLLEIDSSIDEILMTAEQQISNSRNYQNQAWQNFQKLETTPQKAEELFGKIEAAYQNVQQLYVYLQGDLQSYFNETVTTLNTQISSVKSQLDTLKTAGLDLTKQMQTFEEQDEAEERKAHEARCEEQKEEAVEQAIVDERQRVAQQQGVLTKFARQVGSFVTEAVSSVWSMSKRALSAITSLFTGAKEPHPTEGFHAPTDIETEDSQVGA